MNANINDDLFTQAVTPYEVMEIIDEIAKDGFSVNDLEDFVTHLYPAGALAEMVDVMCSDGATNEDIFFKIDTAAQTMITTGYDLLRILELWRGRHLLGDAAVLIERRGSPKIGVMIAKNNRVSVLHGNAIASDVSTASDTKAVAQRLLRSL